MTNLILYNEFESLNEYIRHQQYKYIYKHPLFIKNGNKTGITFIYSKKGLIDTKFNAIVALLSLIGISISISYDAIMLVYILSSLAFISITHAISKFVFTRNKLWKKLEKDFLHERISSKNIVEMLSFLTIEQKEAILNLIQIKDYITFKEMIQMFEFAHNKVEKEKIILTLKE